MAKGTDLFESIIKYLAEHLEIEIDTAFQDCSDNQDVTVKLKIGETVISESTVSIFIGT